METTKIPNSVATEKRPFIKINALLPLQIIKNIPNDDLSEVFMKSRVFSFIGWSFLFTLLTFILVQFAGVDKVTAIYFSLGCGVLYFLLRIAMASEEANKLLSEEVEMKLRRVDSIKDIEKAHAQKIDGLEEMLKQNTHNSNQAQAWIDDFSKKNDALEAKCKKLEIEKAEQLARIAEMADQIEAMNREIMSLDESSKASKIAAYELGVSHTEEVAAKNKSLAQTKLNPDTREEYEARLAEIEKEREEALFA